MGENQEEMEQKSENKWWKRIEGLYKMIKKLRWKQIYYIKTLMSSFSSEQDSKFLELWLLSSAFSS